MQLSITGILKHRVMPIAKGEGGQDLLEYALLAGLISLFAFGSVQLVGDTINTVFWEAIANML